MNYNLQRFLIAQEGTYPQALSEMRNGKKISHWMWFVFPQLKGLGHSATAEKYGITDLKEAQLYLSHPILGKRLREITEVLAFLDNSKSAQEIFGFPDFLKFHSCMTLFSIAANDKSSVFNMAINKYFEGKQDNNTFRLLKVD
jgi:uncharacterized protein (DUF1810 family)